MMKVDHTTMIIWTSISIISLCIIDAIIDLFRYLKVREKLICLFIYLVVEYLHDDQALTFFILLKVKWPISRTGLVEWKW